MSGRRTAFALVAVGGFVTLGLSACGDSGGDSGSTTASSSAGTINVVASTNVWGDIAQQVGGDRVMVTSIISDPAQDPHSYEANATTQLDLSRADVVIENGGGYDDFVDTMLQSHKKDSSVLINAVDVSGKQAPVDGDLNEHVWYDFPTVQKVANSIAAALSAKSPADQATFEANAKTLAGSLTTLEGQEAQIKQAHDGEGVAITEPVPGYLLEASGLVNKTPAKFSEAIEEGTDVPAAVLNETVGLFSDKSVKALVYNEQTSGPETEKVLAAAKDNDVAVVPVTETLPQGEKYVGWMTKNLQALSVALG